MPPIFLSSTGDHAGLSLITLTLSRKFQAKGLNVGFIKPFGTHAVIRSGTLIDKDALLFKEILSLEEPLETINPFPVIEETTSVDQKAIIEKIKSILKNLSEHKDLVLVMG